MNNICPKCGSTYRERPALSREDNKTKICPDCGMFEALQIQERADIERWYQNEMLPKIKDIYIENDKYVIAPFLTYKDIEAEASNLKHALAVLVSLIYKKNHYKFYPLYMRKKASVNTSYCTTAVCFENGVMVFMKDSLGREEIVVKHNRLLEDENLEAYHFVKSNLSSIEQLFAKEV